MNQLQENLIKYGEELIRERDRGAPPPSGRYLQEEHCQKIFDLMIQNMPSGDPDTAVEVTNIFRLLSGDSGHTFPVAPLKLDRVWQAHNSGSLTKEFEEALQKLPQGKGRFDSFTYLLERYGARINAGVSDISCVHWWKTLASLCHCCSPNGDPLRESIILFSGDLSGLMDFIGIKGSTYAAKNTRARSFFAQLLSDAMLRAVLREFQLPRCNLLFSGASRFFILLPGEDEAVEKLFTICQTLSERMLEFLQAQLAPQFAYVTLPVTDLFNSDAMKKTFGTLSRISRMAANRRFQQALEPLAKAFEPRGGDGEQLCDWCEVDLDEDTRYQTEDEDGVTRWHCSQCRHFGWTGQTEEAHGLAQTIAHAYHQDKVLFIQDLCQGKPLHQCKWDELTGVLPESVRSRWRPGADRDRPTWRECLAYLGFHYQFLREDMIKTSEEGEVIRFNPGLWEIENNRSGVHGSNRDPDNQISDFDLLENVTYGWRWAGFATPMMLDESKPGVMDVRDTYQFCKDVSKGGDPPGYGLERYGVLYMDGDGMGQLFSACGSLFHYLLLSDSLALFFEGWTNHLCRKAARNTLPNLEKDYAKTAYLLYAGGDDLLIVAPWIVLPELGILLAEEYRKYVCCGTVEADEGLLEWPPASLSGAMAFGQEKFPLYQLKREVMSRASNAKRFWEKLADATLHERRGNCVDAFGITLPWQEFQVIKQWVDTFAPFLLPTDSEQTAPLSRSFLQRLYAIAGAYQKEAPSSLPDDEVFLGSWAWMSIYLLTRASLDVKKENSEVNTEISKLQRELATWHSKEIVNTTQKTAIVKPVRRLAAMTRWLEILTRKEDQNEQ